MDFSEDFSEINDWLSKHFGDHRLFTADIKSGSGEKKRFVVVCDVSSELPGRDVAAAVSEFTQGGGRFVDFEPLSLLSNHGVNLESDTVLDVESVDSMIISEDIIGGNSESPIPLIVDFPDPSKTNPASLNNRFYDYAKKEGLGSGLMEFDPQYLSSRDLSKTDVCSIMDRFRGEKELTRSPSYIPNRVIAQGVVAGYFEDLFMESNGFPSPFDEAIFHDTKDLRGAGFSIDQAMSDLGLFSNVEDATLEAFREGAFENDKSTPLGYVDEDVLVNFFPARDPNDIPEDYMVVCSGVSGDCYHVIADEGLKRTFEFLNIGAQEYEDYIKKISGGEHVMSRDEPSWREVVDEYGSLNGWLSKPEPSQSSLITLDDLATSIENTNSYGELTWSANINLKDFLSIEDSETVSLSGGVIGFHDAINGSGHMEFAPQREARIRPSEMGSFCDHEMPYGIKSVYGAVTSAFDGNLSIDPNEKRRCLNQCYQQYKKAMNDQYALFSDPEALSVNDKGVSVMRDDNNVRLVDMEKAVTALYGTHYGDEFISMMNDQDKTLSQRSDKPSGSEPSMS